MAKKAIKKATKAPTEKVGKATVSGHNYELIICEKPSTMEKIAQALADGKPVKKSDSGVSFYEVSHGGKDIVVTSAVGHLFTVAEKVKSFKYPSYEVEWRLTADVDKNAAFTKKYATTIKKLAKGAKEFTVATDYDIEGETIGLNIIKYLCEQKDANRMKFSTVTAEDLKEAYSEKQRHLDWGQANAGTTRHVLDWLYGINVSRALTTAVKTAGSFMILSTGRVQGPSLKIVVDREREIRAFVPEDYWQIELEGDHHKKHWEAMHENEDIKTEHEAKALIKKCKGKPAIVDRVERKAFNQAPPTQFDLGTLQTESYRAFGISPKDTLAIAQTLYTGAYISYPRTSSQKLPAKIGYRKILGSLAKHEVFKENADFLLNKSLLTPNEGKKDDPAHPAIFPTGLIPKALGPREAKVYELIVRRFMATFGENAVRETNTVAIVIAGERFLARGTRTLERGWHKLYDPFVDLKEEELPPFKEKETITYKKLEEVKKQTQPPRRFTPASLVSELEKRGLGTKATRAEIVDSLVKRNYVKGQKSFEATELGMKICEILEKAAPEIVDDELTRHFEEELEFIREKDKTATVVLDDAKDVLTKILTKFKKTEKKTGEGLIEARKIEQDTVATLSPCPVCKHGTLKIMFSKKTKRRFIGCDKYPDCHAIFPLPQNGLVQKNDKECEFCKFPQITVIRRGRGPSAQCINPECPKKKAEEEAQKKLAHAAGEGKKCPNCSEGKLALRHSMYGMFLGCDKYPNCKTIVKIPKPEKKE